MDKAVGILFAALNASIVLFSIILRLNLYPTKLSIVKTANIMIAIFMIVLFCLKYTKKYSYFKNFIYNFRAFFYLK